MNDSFLKKIPNVKNIVPHNPFWIGPNLNNHLCMLDAVGGKVSLDLPLDKIDKQKLKISRKFYSQEKYASDLLAGLSFRGRGPECKRIFEAFRQGQNVQIVGVGGIGKDCLLSRVLNILSSDLELYCPDGIIFPYLFSEFDIEDVLTYIFRFFYEIDLSFKPSLGIIKKALEPQRALIVLDLRQRKFAKHDFQKLEQYLPGCKFILINNAVVNFPGTVGVALSGLSLRNSMHLVEDYLDCSLTPMEYKAAQDICVQLHNNPRDIIQNLVPVREQATTLLQVFQRLRITQQDRTYSIRSLSTDENRLREKILTTLSMFPEHGLTEIELSSLIGIRNLKDVLETLRLNEYVKLCITSHFNTGSVHPRKDNIRYKLSGNVAKTLKENISIFNLNSTIDYFLGLQWHKDACDFERLVDRLCPLVSLFRQTSAQHKNSSALALGNTISDICLSLGFWGMRRNILLQNAQMTLINDKRSKIYFDLGLQEMCTANYKDSMHHLESSAQIQKDLGNIQGLEFITSYKDLAAEKLSFSRRSEYSLENEGNSEKAKGSRIGHNLKLLLHSGRQQKDLSENQKRATKPSSFRWILAGVGVSALLIALFLMLEKQFQGIASLITQEAVAMQESNVADDLLQASLNEGRLSSTFRGLNKISLDQTNDSIKVGTSQPNAQSKETVLPGPTPTYAQKEAGQKVTEKKTQTREAALSLRNTPVTRVEIRREPASARQSTGSVAEIEAQSADEKITLTSSSRPTETVNHEDNHQMPDTAVIEPQLAVDNRPNSQPAAPSNPDNTLSASMCSLMTQELRRAERSESQNPEMYRRLISEGNCRHWH